MAIVDVTTDEFKSRLRPFGISFEKSLSDLIKGIRANNEDKQKLSAFFNSSIQECRNELKSNDLELKSMAILKLTYLEMYGFDLPFMNFQILEVMSSMNFQHKRIGYLAAIQILARENNDDVLMLMTNLLKKDLNSSNHVEVGLAISCLSSIVTKDLAQDVIDDLMKMFSHSKPYIRKKAVLASYKVFLKYPESLKLNFSRLIDKLDDSESLSVKSATVNVICELAKKNPRNYIELIPTLFELLTTTNNNWMIIKLLKLFSSLSLVEPRVKKKLLPAVVNLLTTTGATSLVYECINCILLGNMLSPEDKAVSELMVSRLELFVSKADKNLKYVSILAFIKIIHIQPELVKPHNELIFKWLKDEDITIRAKSLELVDGIIDSSNIVDLVSRLLLQLANDDSAPWSYKLQVTQKILTLCSSKKFSLVPNFEWYLATLRDLLHLMKSESSSAIMLDISKQFPELGLRVPSIRASLVETCAELIMDETLPKGGEWWNNCLWCIAEYLNDLIEEEEDEEDEENTNKIAEFVLSESTYSKLVLIDKSNPVLPVYISAIFKIFVKFVNRDDTDFSHWTKNFYLKCIDNIGNILRWLDQLQYSFNFEIQERAISVSELFKILKEALQNNCDQLVDGQEDQFLAPPLFLTQGLTQFFSLYELKPIANGLQQRLGVPEALQIDEVINQDAFDKLLKVSMIDDEEEDSFDEFNEDDENDDYYESGDVDNEKVTDPLIEMEDEKEMEEAILRRKKERLEELKDDPFYISTDKKVEEVDGKSVQLETEESLAKTKRSLRKKSKKKAHKDQVTILDEEDVEGSSERAPTPSLATINSGSTNVNNSNNKLKFKIDDSQLIGFDLKADLDPADAADFPGEYEVEKIRKELLETNLVEEKPKKKKKAHKSSDKKSGSKTKKTDSTSEADLSKEKTKKPKKRKAVIE